MKLSDKFDARRLRLRTPRSWLSRLGTAFAVFFIIFAIFLAITGAASLLSQPAALQSLNESPATARIVLVIGVVLLCIGILMWRRCRRKLRQAAGLSLAPHLMKRRN
jgi:succinate dehydrogenase/fumarate reductase cytochrome b subunit